MAALRLPGWCLPASPVPDQTPHKTNFLPREFLAKTLQLDGVVLANETKQFV
jgi:hypothetical protein